jgi:hypothetical protein
MWRAVVFALLLLCGGCAANQAALPDNDYIRQHPDSFFAPPPAAADSPAKAAR